MAAISYLIFGPSAIASVINFFRKKYKLKSDPQDIGWKKTSIDVLIPTFNEEKRIATCLASVANQSIKPNRTVLIDDASSDNTVSIARVVAKKLQLDLEIIVSKGHSGKTFALDYMTKTSTSEILFILDGDSLLKSNNYLARVIEHIHKNPEVASACGRVWPLTQKQLKKFMITNPVVAQHSHRTTKLFHTISLGIVNIYRTILYQFLQCFIYVSEMRAMGTLINPVGCAVGYRRHYLKELFERHKDLGINLSSCEDIFIGFSFNNEGYHNAQLTDIECLTQEPTLGKFPKQFFLWSSSFLQSSYYFLPLVFTPFKYWRRMSKQTRSKEFPKNKFVPGSKYTKKYGRPIGWYAFFNNFEKASFPICLIVLFFLQLWDALILTMLIETSIMSTVIFISTRGAFNKIKNFFLTFLISPFRYTVIGLDVYAICRFFLDLYLGRKEHWRK